ncbi:GDSL-like lipase/acylhydrolase [Clostridium saccharobutylicum]|uniref:GDSL-like lipase/acylhydrolase n=2 Tax=Clostridium saccharobutylicum TaxID=169679 RepID=A0A1S8NBB1_CLOSA|nr:GDSL-like lipase/acylhydrolase [Clostridium saccharobutylicum]
MIYNPNYFQLRDYQIDTIAKIIRKNRDAKVNGVVFFGDSITEWYDIEKYYSNIKEKYNSGIAGSTSESLIWICDEAVIKYKPRVMVCLVGTNDLGNTNLRSPREIALNVKKIIDLVKGNLPNIKIVLVSTLPCNEKLQGEAAGKLMRTNKNIKMINSEYQEILKDINNVAFVNVFEQFLNKETNNIKDEFSGDGLHLTEEGYDLLTKFVKPVVDSFMVI